MAFGQTVKEKPERKQADGDQTQTFEWQWVPLSGGNKKDKVGGEQILKGGSRKIRLLPAIEDGKIVTDEYGKQVTATESRFLEVWMDVMVGGQALPRRIILDWRKQFDNPYWNLVAQPTEKGSPQRKAQKHKFAINVIDLTPVLTDANGRFVYPNETGQYIVSATGKLTDEVEGKPQPLRKVRILEQSAGDAGGRHFLQQLIDAVSGLEDGDGEPRQPHEVDLLIKVAGVDVDTRRSLRVTANFNALPDELIFAPRYDLENWTRPWPDEAVTALINMADFNQVVDQFNIPLFPELLVAEDEPELTTAPVVEETPPTRRTRGKAKPTNDDEQLFDD